MIRGLQHLTGLLCCGMAGFMLHQGARFLDDAQPYETLVKRYVRLKRGKALEAQERPVDGISRARRTEEVCDLLFYI